MDVVPLGPGFAAELRGVTLADVASDDAAYAAVRAAFEEHSVLVFRGQAVTDEIQLNFSRRFGPPEVTKVGSQGTGSHFVILSTIGPDGKVVPSDHRQALRNKANQLWHTDASFKRMPALTSIARPDIGRPREPRGARGAAAAMLAHGVEESRARPRRDLSRLTRLCGRGHGGVSGEKADRRIDGSCDRA